VPVSVVVTLANILGGSRRQHVQLPSTELRDKHFQNLNADGYIMIVVVSKVNTSSTASVFMAFISCSRSERTGTDDSDEVCASDGKGVRRDGRCNHRHYLACAGEFV
jgi:hypothetical protein